MKKLIKVLTASSMLVGLAACGPQTPAPTWEQKALSWLKSKGVTIESLPTSNAYKGYSPSYDVVSGEDPYSGNQFEYLCITLDSEDSLYVYSDLVDEIEEGTEWGEFNDESDLDDYYVYTDYTSAFNEEGKSAWLTVEYIDRESSVYEDLEGFEYDALFLYVDVLDGLEASLSETYIDEFLDENGFEVPLFTPVGEGEPSPLHNVADFFIPDVTWSDPAYDWAYSYYINAGEEVSFDDSYFEDYGVTYLDFLLEEETEEEAVKAVYNELLNAGLYSAQIPVEGDKGWTATVMSDEAATPDEAMFVGEIYTYYGMEGMWLIEVEFFTNEDLSYMKKLNLMTFSGGEDLIETFEGLVDETNWNIDDSHEDIFGHFIISNELNDDNKSAWIQPINQINMFEINIFCDDPLAAWPTEAINTFLSGKGFHSTVVPTLSTLVQTTVDADGEYIFINGFDNGKHGAVGTLEQTFKAALENQGEGVWTITEASINVGIVVPGYIATCNEEVVDPEDANEKIVVELMFFTYNYQFMLQISTTTCPKEWPTADIGTFISTAGFENTTVPSLPDTNWYPSFDESEGVWIIYGPDEDASYYETYVGKFINSDEWIVNAGRINIGSAVVDGYVIESVEIKNEQVVKLLVLSYNGRLLVQINFAAAPEAFDAASINAFLSAQGFTGVEVPELTGLYSYLGSNTWRCNRDAATQYDALLEGMKGGNWNVVEETDEMGETVTAFTAISKTTNENGQYVFFYAELSGSVLTISFNIAYSFTSVASLINSTFESAGSSVTLDLTSLSYHMIAASNVQQGAVTGGTCIMFQVSVDDYANIINSLISDLSAKGCGLYMLTDGSYAILDKATMGNQIKVIFNTTYAASNGVILVYFYIYNVA